MTQEAERAIAFIKERSLLTIPPLCEETWRLAMLTPEAQKTLPYAVYSSPRIMVAYAHEAMIKRYINGSYGPLYQAAYMIGGLQLRALHHEIGGGGHMTEHAFHDAVLTQRPVPIALIRARLLDETLIRDWKPTRSK